MDLSFPRFDRAAELTVLPPDLSVLMVGIAARQAASPTAAAQLAGTYRAIDDRLFRPISGAFNGAVARALLQWRQE